MESIQMENGMSLQRPYKVVIVGAGLAGLSAAEALVLRSRDGDNNISVEVKVLEAMERPGGRAYTVPFAEGLLEFGAQFVHGLEGNPVYHRAVDHKLAMKTTSDNVPMSFYQQDGKRVPESIISEVYEVYHAILVKAQTASHLEERSKYGDKTVGEFMKRNFEKYYKKASGSPAEKRVKANIFRNLILNECCYSACNHLNDLMLNDFGEYQELWGNMTLNEGYNKFVQTFVNKLPPRTIEYNRPVQTIEWDSRKNNDKSDKDRGSTAVTCAGGQQYEADYVIVTTSLGYLKEHASTMFQPTLPSDKLNLISRMGFGTAAKIFLEFKEPFWPKNWGGMSMLWDQDPGSIMDDLSHKDEWFKMLYGIFPLNLNPRVLLFWSAGQMAEYIETLDDNLVMKKLTDILRQFMNNPTIPAPTSILKSDWYSNPYTRGSYSYVAAGSQGADIDRLAEPVGIEEDDGHIRPTICFAGEATHRTFYSTTHGAMLSGQREADRIIADIRLRTNRPDISEDDGRIRNDTVNDKYILTEVK